VGDVVAASSSTLSNRMRGGRGESHCPGCKGEHLEEEKPQESYTLCIGLIRRCREVDFRVDEDPEVERSCCWLPWIHPFGRFCGAGGSEICNVMRVRTVGDGESAARKEECSEGETP
jgi:hypothetical protein